MLIYAPLHTQISVTVYRLGWDTDLLYGSSGLHQKNSVAPAEGGVRAWAESSTDTMKASIINGAYKISDLKPGTYKLVIEAKPPYKNTAKDGIVVVDCQSTDAGEIRLEKMSRLSF